MYLKLFKEIMRFLHLSVIVLMSFSFLSSCLQKKEEENYKKEAEFIYGTLLILSSQSSNLNPQDGVFFKHLKEITGLSTDSAISFLNKEIRNNPEKGKKLYETVNKIINDIYDSTKN